MEVKAMRGFYQKAVISGVLFLFLAICPVIPQYAMTQPTPLPQALNFKGIEKVAQPEFLEKFTQGAETVKIVVLLKDYENYEGLAVSEDVVVMKKVQSSIRSRQEKVLNTLDKKQFQLRHRFDNILGFSGEATLQAIKDLARMDAVKVIEEDKEMEMLSTGTFEGKKGINASNARAPRSVPAIHNESIVTGKVLAYSVLSSSLVDIKPVMFLYRLQILVETSEEVKGMRSFTKDKMNKLLTVYSKKELSAELFNTVISVRVTYQGDEKGGKFWIRDIKDH
jgi:hypothetical protein